LFIFRARPISFRYFNHVTTMFTYQTPTYQRLVGHEKRAYNYTLPVLTKFSLQRRWMRLYPDGQDLCLYLVFRDDSCNALWKRWCLSYSSASRKRSLLEGSAASCQCYSTYDGCSVSSRTRRLIKHKVKMTTEILMMLYCWSVNQSINKKFLLSGPSCDQKTNT